MSQHDEALEQLLREGCWVAGKISETLNRQQISPVVAIAAFRMLRNYVVAQGKLTTEQVDEVWSIVDKVIPMGRVEEFIITGLLGDTQ